MFEKTYEVKPNPPVDTEPINFGVPTKKIAPVQEQVSASTSSMSPDVAQKRESSQDFFPPSISIDYMSRKLKAAAEQYTGGLRKVNELAGEEIMAKQRLINSMQGELNGMLQKIGNIRKIIRKKK